MDWFLYDNGLRHENTPNKLSSVEKKTLHYLPIKLKNVSVTRVQSQKYLGSALHSKFSFYEVVSSILSEVNK